MLSDMKNLIFLGAIPFFLLMIGLELWMARRRGERDAFRLNDTITNLNIGIGNQVFNLFFQIGILALYFVIFSRYALWQLPVNLWSGLLCILLFDFIFYWAHRWSHEMNFWWGAHVVHHQSEEYNLSVALRQSWFHNILAFILFLPLPFLGFDPAVFFLAGAIHTLYQFWIHTKLIGKLPRWIEFWLNTPSHHRVHHGVNPQYIDKNHGGVFIVWDRLFGTFQQEEEEVVYGITSPLSSWNPGWANVHYYVEMVRAARRMRWRDRFKMIWARPGWRPDYMGGTIPIPEPDPARRKYDARSPSHLLNFYVLGQFVLILAGLCAYMYYFEELQFFFKVLLMALLLLSTVLCGGIMEHKKWVRPLEYIRLFLVLLSLNGLYYVQFLDWLLVMVVASGLGFVLLNAWFTLGWLKARSPLANS